MGEERISSSLWPKRSKGVENALAFARRGVDRELPNGTGKSVKDIIIATNQCGGTPGYNHHECGRIRQLAELLGKKVNEDSGSNAETEGILPHLGGPLKGQHQRKRDGH